MLMITWAVIVNLKQNWLELLPETPIVKSEPKWGLNNIQLNYTGKSTPTIRDVVWGIRNSMAHTDFKVNPGKEGTAWSVFLNETTFTFKDSKKKKFKLEINMIDLSSLNRAIYETIHNKILEYVATKKSGE